MSTVAKPAKAGSVSLDPNRLPFKVKAFDLLAAEIAAKHRNLQI